MSHFHAKKLAEEDDPYSKLITIVIDYCRVVFENDLIGQPRTSLEIPPYTAHSDTIITISEAIGHK